MGQRVAVESPVRCRKRRRDVGFSQAASYEKKERTGRALAPTSQDDDGPDVSNEGPSRPFLDKSHSNDDWLFARPERN